MKVTRTETHTIFVVWWIAILAALLWMVAALFHPAHAHDPKATYLGNEGVMIVDGETKILFDPLFANTFDIYQQVPRQMRKKVLAGEAPFDDVDAIFISHGHPDHFSARDILIFLDNNPETIIVLPNQILSIFDNMPTWRNDYADRFEFIDRAVNQKPKRIIMGDIIVDAVNIPHAGQHKQTGIVNLVYRVTLGDGVTVMHMGDADPQESYYAPHKEFWTRKKTDVNFPPYWMFLSASGQSVLKNYLKADQNIGVHVPMAMPPELEASGEKYFHEPGEILIIGALE